MKVWGHKRAWNIIAGRDRQDEHGHQRRLPARAGNGGKERELVRHGGILEERRQRAGTGGSAHPHGEVGRRDGTDHGDRILVEVRPDGTGEAAEGRVDPHGDEGHRQRRHGRKAEDRRTNLDCRERNGAHDDDVENEAEVDGAETAQRLGGRARITNLVEPKVRREGTPAPELRVDEDGEHAREQEGPPGPVPGDALGADEVRHEVRGVAGEGAGDHRDAQQPPGHRTPGEEEVLGALRRALGRPGADDDHAQEERDDDADVESSQSAGIRRAGRGLAGNSPLGRRERP